MKIGFVGAGNMAEGIIKGLIVSGTVKPADIIVSDIRKDRLTKLKKIYGVRLAVSNEELVNSSEVVILAIKPKDIDSVSMALKNLKPDSMILSILAGISTSHIEKLAAGGIKGKKVPVIRVMPNMPAMMLAGVSGISKGKYAKKGHYKKAEVIFKAVGEVTKVAEQLMDAVTAISGSGPAYLFLFAEAFLEAAIKIGMDAKTAKILVYNTLSGGAKLMSASKDTPAMLRQKVTSPNGTTAAALAVFESRDFKKIVLHAVEAAKKRSEEMTK